MANIFYTFNSSQSLIIIKFSLNVLKQILQFFPTQPYLHIHSIKFQFYIFINDLILKLIYSTKFKNKNIFFLVI
jgi:hypothetical protein